MNLQQFVGEFLGSQHAADAKEALTAAGLPNDVVDGALNHAAEAGHEHGGADEGVLVDRIAAVLVEKAGMDSGTAGTVAATLTPYVVGFVKQKLSSN